jgi:acetyl esterase/lipase
MYTNLGAYFAKRGYLTVIADYRLSIVGDPNGAKSPESSQDLRDALSYTISKIDGIEKVADKQNIWLIGHSAGSTLQACLLFHPTLLPDDLRARIKGLIWNGGVFHFETNPPAMPHPYFGEGDDVRKNSPLGLLKAAPQEHVDSLPPLLIVNAEKELDPIVEAAGDFTKVLRERGFKRLTEYTNEGHNHISSTCALSSGEGEKWGEVVDLFIQGKF